MIVRIPCFALSSFGGPKWSRILSARLPKLIHDNSSLTLRRGAIACFGTAVPFLYLSGSRTPRLKETVSITLSTPLSTCKVTSCLGSTKYRPPPWPSSATKRPSPYIFGHPPFVTCQRQPPRNRAGKEFVTGRRRYRYVQARLSLRCTRETSRP